jgi:hypothetical protein
VNNYHHPEKYLVPDEHHSRTDEEDDECHTAPAEHHSSAEREDDDDH